MLKNILNTVLKSYFVNMVNKDVIYSINKNFDSVHNNYIFDISSYTNMVDGIIKQIVTFFTYKFLEKEMKFDLSVKVMNFNNLLNNYFENIEIEDISDVDIVFVIIGDINVVKHTYFGTVSDNIFFNRIMENKYNVVILMNNVKVDDSIYNMFKFVKVNNSERVDIGNVRSKEVF